MGGQFPKLLQCPYCDKKMETSFKVRVQCPHCDTRFFYWEAKEYYIKLDSFRITVKQKEGRFQLKLETLKKKYCPTT